MSSVLITRRLPGASVARLAAHHDVDLHAGQLPLPIEELHERLEDKAGVVVLLPDRIDRAAIDAAGPSLRIIANVAVGYENLDIPYATSKGIVCTNTPGVLTDATADLTWALILGITRRLGEGERLVRGGNWKGWSFDFMLGSGLAGKLLGIVGGGRIGRAVATRAAAFGMQVAVSSHRDPQWPDAEFMPLDRLIRSADVISLHVPMTEETRHLIDRTALTRMKRSAYLINTTRGPVVDEGALAWGLKEHLIAGAALDVFEREPEVHPDLLGLENVLLAPHLGSATRETRTAMADLAIDNVLAVLEGQAALTPIK
jgi:glyoxylate reductase